MVQSKQSFHPESLKPLPPDERDINVGSLVDLPKLSDLPKAFWLDPLEVKNQIADGNEDFCAAYASCSISELQEGVLLDPEFSFAASKFLTNDPQAWGQDLRQVMRAHVKFGALSKADKIALEPQKRRYFESFPEELQARALYHLKASFVAITGPYDTFDNIRATIYKFRNEKRGVVVGVKFGWPLSKFLLGGKPANGFGHAMAVLGWDEEGLITLNSAGVRAGDKGFHRLTRETTNHFVKTYGAYMFLDVPAEDLKYYIANRVKLNDNYLVIFKKQLVNLIESIKTMLGLTPHGKLCELAKSKIGKDFTDDSVADDEVACAQAVSTLLRELDGSPVSTGTSTLYDYLRVSPKFKLVDQPEAGVIVISPTGQGNGTISNGHTGIYLDDNQIMSNESKSGLWIVNFTRESWRKYYSVKGGYPVYFFKKVA